jgi:phage terminase large subunit-like protein
MTLLDALDDVLFDPMTLPPGERKELLELLAERELRYKRTWLKRYAPYDRQREFHAAGKTHRERLLMAGNQLGKTYAGAAEVAYHLTGKYPADWQGRRWDHATRWLAGSESAELTRKGVQRLLVGPPEDESLWGTGAIPHDCIKGVSRRQGVADALASVVVKHTSGDNSVIQLQSYDQGRSKWQADTIDGVWFDEEPPLDVYSEGLTRTTATAGLVFVTFTPLLGMSDVVMRFLEDKPAGSHVTTMTIAEAKHIPAAVRQGIIDAYPAHEREARANGVPIMGSGRVFPVAESMIKIDPFQIPAYWPRIAAIDFGWDHPAAVVWLAWDRDTDTLYVYDVWCARETPADQQALVIRRGGDWIPVAWPHDGLQHDKGSGEQLAKQYRDNKVAMLPKRATFEDGSNGVEAGITMMLDRMRSRRLRVFNHLEPWFREFRLYHRKDGIIVKKADDLMSATRYGMMMLRHALSQAEAAAVSGLQLTPSIIPGFPVLDPVTGY